MPAMTVLLPRAGAVALLAACASVAVAHAEAPGAPGARTPQLTADRPAVPPGRSLTLHGTGFPRNTHVALLAGPPHGETARIGGALTGRRGSFSATIRIRPGSSPHVFMALACVERCHVKATARFRIVTP
jgi:hypothetical protein